MSEGKFAGRRAVKMRFEAGPNEAICVAIAACS
jgi:hypothetical protein